jgi:RHS repeat-associated protein
LSAVTQIGFVLTIYDKQNLLRAVIQPKGVEMLIAAGWSFTADILNEQMFRYDYDNLKRMITKKVPGAGLVEMVYDLRDRLIMTREARFAVTGNTFWNVTKYDNLNRVVKIGLISNASTRATHQAAADASTDFSYPVVAATEVMQENYYDNYSWVNTQPAIAATMYTGDITSSFFYTSPSSFNVAPQYPQQILADYANVRGLPTGSKVRVLGTTTYLYSVTFYDDDKRVIQVRHGNISGSSGYDHITTQYDFSGKPLRVMHRHEKAGAMARYIRELTKYTYDHANRPLTTTKKIGTSGADIVVSQKSYNERGQLKSNIVGNALETQDYEYNIRNWSVGLNRQWLKNLNTRYFGYELAYDNATTSIAGQSYTNPEYNGNIGGLIWKSGGDKEIRKYDFTYDAANRLLNANFNQYDAGTTSFQNTAFNFTTTMGNGVDPTTAYDANGNILSLTQKGWKLNSSPTIDQLTYTYQTGSNKLTKVADAIPYTSSQLGDFKDGVNTGDDYSYDLSGNLTLDNNKSISSILYTHQNMPYEINITGKGKITYAYDNNGTKWKKTIVDNVSGKTTIWLYMDNFVFKDDTLQFFSFEEGRARYDATQGTPEATKFDFDYFLKDHLGNVRMVLTAEKDTVGYPPATIETATRANELQHYDIKTGQVKATNTVSGAPASFDANCYKVNGGIAGQMTGLGITLKVMAGDKVGIFGESYYSISSGSGPSAAIPLADLLAAFVASTPLAGKNLLTTDVSGLGSNTTSLNALTPSSVPTTIANAHICWVLFDDQLRVVSTGVDQVKDGGGYKAHTPAAISVSKSGYMYIFVSNKSNLEVYFDNLAVTHYTGPILEETHYYPFGLTMAGISSKAIGKAENRYKFNDGTELANKEFSDGSGLEWYETNYRSYDPQLGKFHQIDPMGDEAEQNSPYAFASNNPILKNDPLGLRDTIVNGELESVSDPEATVVVTPKKNYVDNSLQQGTIGSSGESLEGSSANIPLPLAVVGTGLSASAGLAATAVVATEYLSRKITKNRWYVTYSKLGPRGQVYVGRCSGFGASAEDVLARYDASHRMNQLGYGPAAIDVSIRGSEMLPLQGGIYGLINVEVSAYVAIRGREQQLYDAYKLQGRTMGNSINPVSPYNPYGFSYWLASTMKFGYFTPYRATYK